MRIPATVPSTAAGSLRIRSARRRFDRGELALLGLFGLLSLWVIALDLWQMVTHGLVWTGTDGFFIVDQMQYLAWIQSASHHLLISNLFVLRGTPSDYFQPAVAISGVIAALGVAPWLALLLWKPVAVVGLFMALRALAHRTVWGTGQRRALIALGLFFGSFTVVYGTVGVIGDMMPGWLSWGYPFGLIAVALVVFSLLGYERARRAGQIVWAPGLLGALSSTLHPWQGELLILILVIAEGVRWRENLSWRRLALPLLTAVLTGLPLIYYLLLGHLDLSWSLARQASRHSFSLASILLGIAPLGVVALLGYRGRPRTFLELVMRAWPLAALVIYVFSASGLSATPLHAFNGITVPLAMLAVLGVVRTRWPVLPRPGWLAAGAIVLATVPANAYAMAIAPPDVRPTYGNANFITRDERDAISYLRHDPVSGGVLTQFYLGEVVPGRTGRHVLVGDCLWSEPECMPHSEAADALFNGTMSPRQAQTFVRLSQARFVLASCQVHGNLARLLGPELASVKRFGCAAVYELNPASSRSPAGAPAPAL